MALSGIGGLAATLADRSVTTALKRRRPSEPIAQLRIGRMGHLHELRRRITRWVADHEERVGERDPKMPDGIINREADNLTVLLAIAEEASGAWPARARKAAEAAHIAGANDDASRLEQMLADIRNTFIDRKVDEIGSKQLVEALVHLEGRPWAEMGKNQKPLTQHQLARWLKPLGITTNKIGPKDDRVGGYLRTNFAEAFARYLPPLSHSNLDTRTECDEIRTSELFDSDSHEPGCPSRKCEKPNNGGLLSDCPSTKRGNGPGMSPATRRQLADLAYATLGGGDFEALEAFVRERVVAAIADPDHVESDVAAITEMLAVRDAAGARAAGPPVCAFCGRPGGNEVAFGDGGSIRLHRECEQPWIELRVAEEGIRPA